MTYLGESKLRLQNITSIRPKLVKAVNFCIIWMWYCNLIRLQGMITKIVEEVW